MDITDTRPREITIILGTGMTVELWPGADDHDRQEEWLAAAETAIRTARTLMWTYREEQQGPEVPQ